MRAAGQRASTCQRWPRCILSSAAELSTAYPQAINTPLLMACVSIHAFIFE